MQLKKNRYATSILVVVTVSTLAACSATPRQIANQPAVAPGATVRLNISAEIPANQDRIHIQNSRLVTWEGLDEYQVYCSVVMHRYQDSDAPRMKIEPGEFTVSRVRLYNDYVHNPVIYANNDDPFYYPSFGVDYRTELHLQSADQPDIKFIGCTRHKKVYDPKGFYPQRPQFEATLGAMVELN